MKAFIESFLRFYKYVCVVVYVQMRWETYL